MKILVMNRQSAIATLRGNLYGHSTLVISISDPDKDNPTYQNENLVDAIYVKFWDVEKDYPNQNIYRVTREEVADIKPFIDKYKDKNVDYLIVHCEAGISRSAAVASAIAEYLGLNQTFFDEEHHPNYHVYKLMCEEFGIGKTEEYYKDLFKETYPIKEEK